LVELQLYLQRKALPEEEPDCKGKFVKKEIGDAISG
jgi:hypothetical protein